MSTPGAANAPGNPAPPTGQIELRIVVTSTRPHRLGPVVADWVRNHAPTDRFAVEVLDHRSVADRHRSRVGDRGAGRHVERPVRGVVGDVHTPRLGHRRDLAELNLPLLDEPEMASTGIYHHVHTHRWRELVTSADAIVWVMPEYNNGYPASIKNAIDYLYAEWAGKPIALFAYGHSGGASASAQLSVVLSRVKATLVDGVGLRYRDHLDGTVGPEATVRADAELLGATRRMYAALAAAARPN